MKRLLVILSTALFVLVGGMVLSTSSAEASVPRYSFQTEDGKWDGEVYNPDNDSDVQIKLISPLYLKTSEGKKKLSNYSKLKVRLVNAKTGKTTSYQSFKGGKSLFTSMRPAKYYVDVKDSYASGKVKGKLDIVFMEKTKK